MNLWEGCILDAAGECGVTLTDEQLTHIAEAVAGMHDNYYTAGYSPPSESGPSFRERELEAALESARRELNEYRSNVQAGLRNTFGMEHRTFAEFDRHGNIVLTNCNLTGF